MCLAMNRGLENNFLCTEIHVLSALKKYKAKVCIVLFGCVNSFVHSFIQKTLTGKKKKHSLSTAVWQVVGQIRRHPVK